MKRIRLNKYSIAGILLLTAAGILVALALVFDFGEFVTAAFVTSGTACALTGIFLLTFIRNERIDPRQVGTLTAQWCKNIGRIESDLGITGNAYFLPRRITGESVVMQFNPTLTYSGSLVSAKDSFTKTGTGGLIITPCCDPWIRDLKERNAMVIPNTEEDLIVLINETLSEIFEFAARVSGSWRENTIALTFHDYQFLDGCSAMTHESEELCTMNPCPACSLCGVLIAEGTDRVVTLDQCSVNPSSHDVTAVFSMLPHQKVAAPQSKQPPAAESGSTR